MTKRNLNTLKYYLDMLRENALDKNLPVPLDLVDMERIVSMQQLVASLVETLENNEETYKPTSIVFVK